MNLIDIVGAALKVAAFVNPADAPIAALESEAAPLLQDLWAEAQTPEGKKFLAGFEAVLVKHGTSSHAVAQSLGSAHGRLVSERDQVMLDKTEM